MFSYNNVYFFSTSHPLLPNVSPVEGRDFVLFTVVFWGQELSLGHSRCSVNKSNELNPSLWPLSLELNLKSTL